MKKAKVTKKFLALTLIPLAIMLNKLSAGQSRLTEDAYSLGIYKFLVPVLSRVTGLFPYSLAESILTLLITLAIWRLFIFFRSGVKKGKLALPQIGEALSTLLLACGIIYLSFLFLWGFNYNRLSIGTITGLEVKPSSVRELTLLAQNLAREANLLRARVQENVRGVMTVPGGPRRILKRAALGYDAISASIPQLGGSFGPPKPVFMSAAMSYTGIWGVYFPFTGEANVNISIPEPCLAFATAHEMAHQRGFAREDEANYIAYLACRSHPDTEFRYSGNLMALVHVSRSLARADLEQYMLVSASFSEGVKRDMKSLEDFNKRHESPLERISLRINDLYLKANGQKDGDKSYGRVVDLLLAEYRSRNQ